MNQATTNWQAAAQQLPWSVTCVSIYLRLHNSKSADQRCSLCPRRPRPFLLEAASIASKSDIYGNKFGEFARGSLIGNYDGDYSHAADALADAAKACKLTASGDSRPFDRYDRYDRYDRNPSQRAPNNGKKRAAGDPRRSRSRSR